MRCPLCQGVCGFGHEESVFFYKCSTCEWTSKECNVVADLEEGSDLSKVEFKRALQELGAALNRQRASEDVWKAPWKALAKGWDKRNQEGKLVWVRHRKRKGPNDLLAWQIYLKEVTARHIC